MKIEPRYGSLDDGTKVLLGLVLLCESEEESQFLDKCCGSQVIDSDGLIGTGTYEVRIADGYGEHYVYLKSEIGRCDFCGESELETELTMCGQCEKLFCHECEPHRDDDIPEDFCEECCSKGGGDE